MPTPALPYALLDSGHQRKLERFGQYTIVRPAAQAIWPPQRPALWDDADASFRREPRGVWENRQRLPESWQVEMEGLHFKLAPTDFGHLGIFPEQRELWQWLMATVRSAKPKREKLEVLNLFAYSGASTVALAYAGAAVCHLDAARGMVNWAAENCALNNLADAPIRWIVDDAGKFLERELRRGRRYEGIVLHPPSFGRGPKGEIFKIEEQLPPMLATCRQLLSEQPLLFAVALHTPEISPMVLRHLLALNLKGLGGTVESGEMLCTGDDGVLAMPNGVYGRWRA